ncbi:redoxin domain-containing protein [Pedobacter sp. PLR]|nr:redoxin domain-containing protein [Pedobacter sp. PLR]
MMLLLVCAGAFMVSGISVSGILKPKIFSWSKLSAFHLMNTAGKNSSLVSDQPTVLVMLSPECPLCQNYVATIAKLKLKFPKILFYGLVPGKAYSTAELAEFVRKYKVNFPVLIDKNKSLTQYIHATTTPEAVVIDRMGAVPYRGLIDNWAVSLGQKRQIINEHYLEDALTELNANKISPYKETKPVGCLINDL